MKLAILALLCLQQSEPIFKATVQKTEIKVRADSDVKVKTRSKLVKYPSNKFVQVHYLASEPWCVYCQPVKRRYEAKHDPNWRVISSDEARAKGAVFRTIPHEFTVMERMPDLYQPPVYRFESKAVYDVEGSRVYTKETLINHLRKNPNHINKKWQKWYLESWNLEQLQALHDDDHNGVVPEFDDPD